MKSLTPAKVNHKFQNNNVRGLFVARFTLVWISHIVALVGDFDITDSCNIIYVTAMPISLPHLTV